MLKGALIGTGAGVYAGLAVGEVGSPDAQIWPIFVVTAVGAGIGAGIGMVIDAVRADRHLIISLRAAADRSVSSRLQPGAAPVSSSPFSFEPPFHRFTQSGMEA